MKRQLLIEVDCGKRYCKRCDHRSDVTGRMPQCLFFNRSLKSHDNGLSERCKECLDSEVEVATCTTCEGRGRYEVQTYVDDAPRERQCAQCRGTGKVIVGPKKEREKE